MNSCFINKHLPTLNIWWFICSRLGFASVLTIWAFIIDVEERRGIWRHLPSEYSDSGGMAEIKKENESCFTNEFCTGDEGAWTCTVQLRTCCVPNKKPLQSGRIIKEILEMTGSWSVEQERTAQSHRSENCFNHHSTVWSPAEEKIENSSVKWKRMKNTTSALGIFADLFGRHGSEDVLYDNSWLRKKTKPKLSIRVKEPCVGII